MRFVVKINLKNQEIPTDYRPVMISMMKNALTQYENGRYLEEYYAPSIKKPFAFAVNLGKCKFSQSMIAVETKQISLQFTTNKMGTAIIFFNALLEQKGRKYPMPLQNEMTISNISLKEEQVINKETIRMQMLSPLCIREHEEVTNTDRYYTIEDKEFEEQIKRVIKVQIKGQEGLNEKMVDEFSIQPVNCKKTVVKHHKVSFPVSLGIFELTGPIPLLTYLYQGGLGSRSSACFGFGEVIGS